MMEFGISGVRIVSFCTSLSYVVLICIRVSCEEKSWRTSLSVKKNKIDFFRKSDFDSCDDKYPEGILSR